MTETQLHAPMEIAFDYTRSLGPVLGEFMTGLRDRRLLGARGRQHRRHGRQWVPYIPLANPVVVAPFHQIEMDVIFVITVGARPEHG